MDFQSWDSRRFMFLAACIMLSHSVASIACEFVFVADGFQFGWFYALLEFVFFCLMSAVKHTVFHRRAVLIDAGFVTYSVLAGASMLISHGCGTACYVELNYTSALVFKSSKVPLVMAGAMLINGERPNLSQAGSAICIVGGLMLFGFGDGVQSPRFSMYGVLLIMLNLGMGSATANIQQKAFHTKDSPSCLSQFMAIQYGIASCLAFVVTCITGEFWAALAWYRDHDWWFSLATVADIFLSYIGLDAIMHITAEFDATLANTVITCRKPITFACSLLLFPKVFGTYHAIGLCLLLLGTARLYTVRASEHRQAKRD